jgi:hypothetical protein
LPSRDLQILAYAPVSASAYLSREMEMHTAESIAAKHAIFMILGLLFETLAELIRRHASENITNSHYRPAILKVTPQTIAREKQRQTIERICGTM